MAVQKYEEKMKYPIKIKGKTIKQVTKLNLSGLGLKEFPENLFEYTNLTKLVLSNNRIRVIPKEILKLKKLKVLDLANNEIKVLHSAVFKLPKLRALNLYGNQIKKFPKQIEGSKIKKIIALNNPIEEVEYERLSHVCEIIHPKKEAVVEHELKVEVKVETKKETVEVKEDKKMEKMHSIFISYSHADEVWLKKLLTHLKSLKKYYGLDEWEDKHLRTSDKWEEEITKALNRATFAILLVSADFLASDFIDKNELQPLLKNAENKGTKIMPLIVSPCATFVESGLSVYQAANDPKRTLIEMNEGEVQRTLAKLVEDIKSFVK